MTYLKSTTLLLSTLGTSLLLISSCGQSDGQGIPLTKKDGETKSLGEKGLVSLFSKPTPIDSTSIILYPLALHENGDEGDELLRYSSEYDNGPFWNIAFYDSSTGNSNLLDSGRTIRINTFQKLKTLIVYAVTVLDYNGNNKLDDKDPVYLYTSDLDGRNFKQISPNNIDSRSFQVPNNQETLLVQAMKDSNNDRKFGKGDEVIPMIFDAARAITAKAVFPSSFKNKIKQEFEKVY